MCIPSDEDPRSVSAEKAESNQPRFVAKVKVIYRSIADPRKRPEDFRGWEVMDLHADEASYY